VESYHIAAINDRYSFSLIGGKKMIRKIGLLLPLCLILVAHAAGTQTARQLFNQAKAEEAAGRRDVAFLLYRQIVRQFQDSPRVQESLFLIGQYYYDARNYFDADQTFRAHLRRFPQSRFKKDIQDYLAKIHRRSLKDRADALFEEGKLGPASVLYEQYLRIDPENAEVKEHLDQINKSMKQVHFGFEQLERDRKKLDLEKADLNRRIEMLEEQRKQVLALQRKAEELNQAIVQKYEKQLADAKSQLQTLEQGMSELQDEVNEWRQRAVLLEGTKLSQPLPSEFEPTLEDRFLPRVIVEGVPGDSSLEEGEVGVSDVLREGFPVVVITASKLDAKENVRHVEAVVSAELTSQWPQGAKLKFRVDFIGKEGQPEPDPKSIVRYYNQFDMDDIDDAKRAYRKRVVFTAEEDKMARYKVNAYLVKSQ
jgi:tetratricopeptide (TPR) repeat protein